MDLNKDSVILEEAIDASLEKLQKSATPSEELTKVWEEIQKKTSQSTQAYVKAIEKLQKSVQPSHRFLEALSDANRIKKIIETYEKK